MIAFVIAVTSPLLRGNVRSGRKKLVVGVKPAFEQSRAERASWPSTHAHLVVQRCAGEERGPLRASTRRMSCWRRGQLFPRSSSPPWSSVLAGDPRPDLIACGSGRPPILMAADLARGAPACGAPPVSRPAPVTVSQQGVVSMRALVGVLAID